MFTRRLNTEARATSEAYKKMTDSVSSSFTTAFGEGINRAIGDTSIELTNLNKAMHIAGEGAAILVAGGLALAESAFEMLAYWIGKAKEALDKYNNTTTVTKTAAGLPDIVTWEQFQKLMEDQDGLTPVVRDKLNKLAQQVEDNKKAQEDYNKALKETLSDESAWQATIDATGEATIKNREDMEKLATAMKEYTDTIASGIASAVTEAKSFDEALKDILKSIAKMALNSALQKLFDIGIGAATGFTPGVTPSVLHGGGEVGLSGGKRSMPAVAWANAPRFHGGFMPGEYPAILQRGESVLTASQRRALGGRGGSTFNMPVNIDARGADKDGLMRVEATLRDMQRTLPSKVIQTMREARSRRVTL
jgi:tetratricopeptide (TPR) repeat protein